MRVTSRPNLSRVEWLEEEARCTLSMSKETSRGRRLGTASMSSSSSWKMLSGVGAYEAVTTMVLRTVSRQSLMASWALRLLGLV